MQISQHLKRLLGALKLVLHLSALRLLRVPLVTVIGVPKSSTKREKRGRTERKEPWELFRGLPGVPAVVFGPPPRRRCGREDCCVRFFTLYLLQEDVLPGKPYLLVCGAPLGFDSETPPARAVVPAARVAVDAAAQIAAA